MRSLLLSFCLLILVSFSGFSQTANLMPVPQSVKWGSQKFRPDKNFRVIVPDKSGPRVKTAATKFLNRLDNKTHLLIDKSLFSSVEKPTALSLIVSYNHDAKLSPGIDESYNLTVTGDMITLSAENDVGIIYGFETLYQLIDADEIGYFFPGVIIDDHPRFQWRGLLIDVCRHFMPVDVIKRNLEGMAMMKMNVLHLHLSEDQGFRMECKTFPLLHEKGSNGQYFTQEQIRDIIAYADERGIRVVPEFDMPGHATSWMVGYPQLASGSGPFEIEKKFGVFDPVMNPARKSTYKFLKKFIREMTSLFPDEYFHIGGDENNGKQWSESKEIKAFMNKHDLKDNHELHNYFNTKLFKMVSANGKKMVGWDEILQPGLPQDAMIQSWRGKEGLKEAVDKKYNVILSNGYYIDLCQPAWKHYINDPAPADSKFDPTELKYILGGEATMWAELVTPETVDSRIWPRTAAIAERLWSDRGVNNIPDMYRRLDVISINLEVAGLRHITNQVMMIRRITGRDDNAALLKLIEIVEPLKDYKRHAQGIAYSTDLPFTRLPDIALPESKSAREFRLICEQLVKKRDYTVSDTLKSYLLSWQSYGDSLVLELEQIPATKKWIPLIQKIQTVCKVGLESLDLMNRRSYITDEWTSASYELLKSAAAPVEECELAIVEPVMMLFQFALPK